MQKYKKQFGKEAKEIRSLLSIRKFDFIWDSGDGKSCHENIVI